MPYPGMGQISNLNLAYLPRAVIGVFKGSKKAGRKRDWEQGRANMTNTGTRVDLLQISLAERIGAGKKARETCNTWHAH